MTDIGAMLMREIPPEDLVERATSIAPHVDELWIIEDLNWAGGISQLGTILEATDNDSCGRPVLGHGIAPAPFRNPAALAMEWATLARMYPGRLHCGIGHGLPHWMEWIGEKVESPLTLLRETIECTQQILRGEAVEYTGRYITIRGVELEFPPSVVPPILAGVTGPRSLELSGMVADGTLLPEGFDGARIEWAQDQISTGRRSSNARHPHRLAVFVGYYLGDLDRLPPPAEDGDQPWVAVTDNIDEMVAALRPVMRTGLDSLVLIPFGPDPAGQVERFQADVRPHLSA
ncbi:MAG: LLM class flavin-dependent oxidoreductase [Acidimicrobiales bacterium]